MREKFGGKMRSRSRICDYEQFCYDLSYICCLNHIQITISHELIRISAMRGVLQIWKSEGAWPNLHVNSNMWGYKLTQNLPMNTMAMVFCSYDAPNSNFPFSLQNEHAWATDHMMKFHAMP